MKKIFWLMMILAGLVLPATGFSAEDEPYRIGPGDVLNISVWKNEDLTRQLSVLPDGMIHIPLAGELKAEGLSVEELKALLISRLEKYMPDPVLTVSITQTNSMMVYVIGKVNNPGRFMVQENIDVLQALALAGGLNPFAKDKEIRIFRKSPDKTDIFMFDYTRVSEGDRLEQNIRLERGDVIVVR
ncbi:MAG: polysaccharide export protein [Desulfobacula sp.]|nr:polysaccharide export protein [Desulfobacula sp.]